MPKKKTWLANSLFILVTCTSNTPAPEITPFPQPTPPKQETPIVEATGPWTFTTSSRTHRYQSRSFTTINETGTPKTRADTIRLDTYFTISISPLHSSTTLAGQIDSVVLSRNTRAPIDKSAIKLPIPFTGELISNVLTLRPSESQPECISPASTILKEIRPVIFLYPAQLFSNSVWKDSLSTTTCSSTQIPTTVESVSSYRVTGRTTYGMIPALVIQRTDSTHFVGHGAQSQHQVEITGTGTSLADIYLDINTGTVILTDTNTITSITLRISGREHRFIQEVKQKVDLIP